jgi:hypothetical protein
MGNFKALMNEMVKTTANEPKTLNYEWTLGEDGKTCHLYERYADSEAMVAHLGSFGKNFAERFLAVVTPTRLGVYGVPSDEAKEALGGFSPVYMTPIGGFAR